MQRPSLTEGSISRGLFKFALPILLANILQSLNGSVNSIWVGRYLGEAALTATEPVEGSVVGPIAKLPADVMKPGIFVEVPQAPKGLTGAPGAH